MTNYSDLRNLSVAGSDGVVYAYREPTMKRTIAAVQLGHAQRRRQSLQVNDGRVPFQGGRRHKHDRHLRVAAWSRAVLNAAGPSSDEILVISGAPMQP